jgi:predicted phage terminase large subunit-like protein
MNSLILTGKSPVSDQVLLDAILRSDLASFVRKVFETVSPGDRFAANWHIKAMCHHLSKVMRGETQRLIITVPPRHLKSICSSVALPAFILGHDPTRRIICVSYSQELAVKHANDCRMVMTSEWYRRVFPATRLDAAKNTEAEVMTTRRGFRLSTSVGGTLTGRGGNLIIIDDPIKPADAMSDSTRERLIQWYGTTLLSRLDDKEHDAIILVMQRLHVGDLAGHLLEQGGCEHLNLPAIAETEQRIEIGRGRYHVRKVGDLIHPGRESTATLDAMKTLMGSAIFWAQYQQSPIPPGGNIVKWEWFRWYDPDDLDIDDVVISWDTAMKPTEFADYSVGTVWGVKGGFYYLVDVIRERFSFPELKRKAIEVYERWQQQGKPTVLIEEAGSGASLIQELYDHKIPVISIRPEGDKVMRMDAQTAKIEAGAVHLPRQAPWLDDLRSELLAFPQGLHDDQVDSISQALKWMSRPRRKSVFFSVPSLGGTRFERYDPGLNGLNRGVVGD